MMGRLRRGLVALLIVALGTALGGAESVAKQDVKIELFYSGVWNDHSTDVYTRDPVSIVHAAGNEQRGLVPSEASLTFQGRDGRLNPANIRSPLHGLIGRNTPIRISIGTDLRFSGQVVSWKPRRAVKGDAWVQVIAGGTLRQLGQGDPPVESALYRAILSPTVTGGLLLAYWSAEDGEQADRFGSALQGGQPLNVPGGLTLADETTLPGSLPLPSRAVGTPAVTGTVHLAPATGTSWTYDLWIKAPVVNAGQTELFMTNGEVWEIFQNSIGEVDIFHTTAGGTVTFVMGTTAANGVTSNTWHNIRLTATQDGADTDLQLFINGVSKATGTKTATSIGVPTRVQINDPDALGADSGWEHFGHVNVWDGIPSVNFYQAGLGYPREKAGDRFNRLCAEEDITATIVGTAAATQPMGPQYPDTTLALLAEIAATDNGRIHDTRSQLGVTMRTGRSLYNQ